MLFTVFGITTFVKLEWEKNALFPMLTTVRPFVIAGMVIVPSVPL